MRIALAVALLAVAPTVAVPLAFGQTPTTRPVAAAPADVTSVSALELRANQAFNGGKYAEALPVFQQLATQLKDAPDQADKFAMVQEQIRVCKKNIAASPAARVAAPKDDRKPHPAPKPGEVQDMAIKELGNFEYDPDQNTQIPDDVKAMDGSTVRLHGYMVPLDQAENVSKFALVPSLFNCCFGQPPQMQHTIIVTCPKGKAVSYYPDEIIVEGKLKVEVMKDEGYIIGIFGMEPASIKPAAK